MNRYEMNLNIRYDAPDEVWAKVAQLYPQLKGWLGYGQGGEKGQIGIPYWFGYNDHEKHIDASVEPSGLFFSARMPDNEWQAWKKHIKTLATRELGYIVGEIEEGEVDF